MISSVETNPETRKSQPFVDFVDNKAIFPSRLRYLRRLNARFLCMIGAERSYAISSVETRPDACKSQLFFDFFSKSCVISLPFETFTTFTRSFHFILHAERWVRVFQRRNKTKHTQIATIRRFCRKLSTISLPFEIFRRLDARFIPFYMQNVVHASFSVEINPESRKSQPFVDFVEN